MSKLPIDYVEHFDRKYWLEVCSSEFLECFENLRDVKRFANSLEFNMSLMHKKDSIEVNIIDFLSIEFIRVWYPKLYYSIKINKSLFTTVPSRYSPDEFDKGISAFENIISDVDTKNRDKIEKLLFVLFPQCKHICSKSNYTTDGKEWSRKLRICSKNHFDSYFVMIPGGGKDEITQYEVELFLYNLKNIPQLQGCLNKYVEESRIDKILRRLYDYTDDFTRISRESAINLIAVLFNLYGNIPYEEISSKDNLFLDDFPFVPTNEDIIVGIIIKLIDREKEEDNKYNVILESIQKSDNAMGIVHYLTRCELEEDNKQIFSEEHLESLKALCVVKLEQTINEDTLLSAYDVILIIECWKRWSKDSIRFKHVLSKIIEDNNKLLSLIKLHLNYRGSSEGSYIDKSKPFYDTLDDLIDIDAVYIRVESIKNSKGKEYESQKEVIDLFLVNYSASKQASL
ncbi:hypothetical protein [uncultured Methanomethylovorans sp.]|uniref:hypothetical protein n=1 Tax=uncultured Methanomethylovorans sp. TaxID=183759 RepID=UPI002AA7BAFA|nr:hypothetical protein [uncultured Methanomethylovorans sp.]